MKFHRQQQYKKAEATQPTKITESTITT